MTTFISTPWSPPDRNWLPEPAFLDRSFDVAATTVSIETQPYAAGLDLGAAADHTIVGTLTRQNLIDSLALLPEMGEGHIRQERALLGQFYNQALGEPHRPSSGLDAQAMRADLAAVEPAAISIPFGSLPTNMYIRGPRYQISFSSDLHQMEAQHPACRSMAEETMNRLRRTTLERECQEGIDKIFGRWLDEQIASLPEIDHMLQTMYPSSPLGISMPQSWLDIVSDMDTVTTPVPQWRVEHRPFMEAYSNQYLGHFASEDAFMSNDWVRPIGQPDPFPAWNQDRAEGREMISRLREEMLAQRRAREYGRADRSRHEAAATVGVILVCMRLFEASERLIWDGQDIMLRQRDIRTRSGLVSTLLIKFDEALTIVSEKDISRKVDYRLGMWKLDASKPIADDVREYRFDVAMERTESAIAEFGSTQTTRGQIIIFERIVDGVSLWRTLAGNHQKMVEIVEEGYNSDNRVKPGKLVRLVVGQEERFLDL